MPDTDKMQFDLGLPELTPILTRKKSLAQEIANIDVMSFNVNPLPLKDKEIADTKTFIYEGYDILTDEKLLEREYTIPPAQTAEEVIGYYARRIAQNIKLPSQFAALAPKIREFFKHKAFGKEVDLEDKTVVRAMSSQLASYVVAKVFEKVLREAVVEEKTPELITPSRKLSSSFPFPFSKIIYEAKKTIYNYVACDNNFERDFAKFLDNAEDVRAFAKLTEQFGFCIEYTDKLANIRHYYPDFVVKLSNDEHWIVETKGREDVEVAMKDEAARNWCDNATQLIGTKWQYLKVLQKNFEDLHPEEFNDLLVINLL